jgi:hypothetical protein
MLQHLGVGDVVEVSEVNAAYIFRVQVCMMANSAHV